MKTLLAVQLTGIAMCLSGILTPVVAERAKGDATPGIQAYLQQEKGEQDSLIKLSVDRTKMGLAERLRYTLTVQANTETSIEFEPVTDTFGPFQVVEYNPFGPVPLQNDRRRWQREYVLAANLAGDLVIPSLTIYFYPATAACITADDCEMTAHGRRDSSRGGARPKYQLTTDEVTIHVDTVLTDASDLTKPRDVLTPVAMGALSVDTSGKLNVLWALLLVLAPLTYLGWRRLHRPKIITAMSAPPANISAGETALNALADLRSKNLSEAGEQQNHHTIFSHILRRYIDEAFGISAHERTTREIVMTISQDPRVSPYTSSFEQLLQRCDLAKFAKIYPDLETGESMLDDAEETIRQSYPDRENELHS